MPNIGSLLNPFSNQYHAQHDFKKIKPAQKFLTIVLTALAALVTLPILGLGGVAAFRLLTRKFTPIQKAPEPVKKTAQKTGGAASKVVKTPEKKAKSPTAPKTKQKTAKKPIPPVKVKVKPQTKAEFSVEKKRLSELAKKKQINAQEVMEFLKPHEKSGKLQKLIESCVDDPALTPALRLVIADLSCSDAILKGLHARQDLASHHYELIASFPPKKNADFFENLKEPLEKAFEMTFRSTEEVPPAAGIFRNPKYLEKHIQIFEEAIDYHICLQRELPKGAVVSIGDVFKACQTTSCLRDLFGSSLHFVGFQKREYNCGPFAQPFLDALDETGEHDWKRLFVFRKIRHVDQTANTRIALKSMIALEERFNLKPSAKLKQSWDRFRELADWRGKLQGKNFELREDLTKEDVLKIFPLMGCPDKAYVEKEYYGRRGNLRVTEPDRLLASKLNEKFPGSVSKEFIELLNSSLTDEEVKKCIDELKKLNEKKTISSNEVMLTLSTFGKGEKIKALVVESLREESELASVIHLVVDDIPGLRTALESTDDDYGNPLWDLIKSLKAR